MRQASRETFGETGHPSADSAPATYIVPPYDLHNHTVHCGHAEEDATVARLVTRARQLGLTHLGISEHVMCPSDIAHIDLIRSEIEEISSPGMELLLGVEMDLDPADPDGNWVLPAIDCDYLILSPHAFPQFDLDIPESDRLLPIDMQRWHLAAKWFEWYRKGIERGGCAILGHPLREPIAMNLVDLSNPEMMELAVDTLSVAIDQGIAFELNNSFLGAVAPSIHRAGYLELLMRLHKRGMKFSRGSDSHDATRVGACEAVDRVARTLALRESDWLDVTTIRRPGLW